MFPRGSCNIIRRAEWRILVLVGTDQRTWTWGGGAAPHAARGVHVAYRRRRREKTKQSDSQTVRPEKQTIRQSDPAGRQSDTQTVRPGRQTVRQSDSHTRHADSQTVRHSDLAGRQSDCLTVCLPGLSV